MFAQEFEKQAGIDKEKVIRRTKGLGRRAWERIKELPHAFEELSAAQKQRQKVMGRRYAEGQAYIEEIARRAQDKPGHAPFDRYMKGKKRWRKTYESMRDRPEKIERARRTLTFIGSTPGYALGAKGLYDMGKKKEKKES